MGKLNCLLINDRAVSQPKDIAKHFNDYFTSICKKLQKHIRSTKRKFSDNLKNPNAEVFFMTPTTPEEISDLIQTLRSNKSTGPNSIPTSILKEIKNETSIPFLAIINNFFKNRIFPNRPVSLLSKICKFIKKLIHKRLLNHFLEQHKVFYALQFDFCLNTSTNNALMSITENIQTNFDKNELTAGVFNDLRKAFNTVDHDILLKNLTTIELGGWLMAGSTLT